MSSIAISWLSQKLNSRRIAFAVFALVLTVGTAHRLAILKGHFGHIDDLGIASDIILAKATPLNPDNLLAEVRIKEAEGRGTAHTAALLKLSTLNLARPAAYAYAVLYPFVRVPVGWNYPPLPFVATPFLISPGQSYEGVKFWGRLPSLVFTVAAMLLMAAIALKLPARAP